VSRLISVINETERTPKVILSTYLVELARAVEQTLPSQRRPASWTLQPPSLAKRKILRILSLIEEIPEMTRYFTPPMSFLVIKTLSH
jgi:hypothetical protein